MVGKWEMAVLLFGSQTPNDLRKQIITKNPRYVGNFLVGNQKPNKQTNYPTKYYHEPFVDSTFFFVKQNN